MKSVRNNKRNIDRGRRVSVARCRHPASRRVVIEQWVTETTVYETYPCECGEQGDGVAFFRESILTEWGYTTGHPEEDGPTDWDRPETTDMQCEIVEEEQYCDCFPEMPDGGDWDIENGDSDTVESSACDGCEVCGAELNA